MGSVVAQVLALAVGVAISPVPIIALILMLFTPAAKKNSIAFAVGWVLGLTAIGLIVLAVAPEPSSGGESDTTAVVRAILGLLFVALAIKQWKSRPKPGDEPGMPKWMDAIDTFTPAKAFGVAVLLSAVNPKNLGITIAAAATISSSGLDTTEQIITLCIYVLMASVTILVPVIAFLVLGKKVDKPLTEAKTWLLHNNNTVMFVLLLVIGAKLLGDGLAVLL